MQEYRNIDHEKVEGSSNKSLGIVFGIVFGIIALWPLIWGGEPRLWATAIATIFLLLALVLPHTLAPLNKIWTRFGLLLHGIVTPLIMGVVFFGLVTPLGLLMRALGKRPLNLKFLDQASYWIKREPTGPEPESFNHQF